MFSGSVVKGNLKNTNKKSESNQIDNHYCTFPSIHTYLKVKHVLKIITTKQLLHSEQVGSLGLQVTQQILTCGTSQNLITSVNLGLILLAKVI